jgi:hypothetical protein
MIDDGNSVYLLHEILVVFSGSTPTSGYFSMCSCLNQPMIFVSFLTNANYNEQIGAVLPLPTSSKMRTKTVKSQYCMQPETILLYT